MELRLTGCPEGMESAQGTGEDVIVEQMGFMARDCTVFQNHINKFNLRI